MRVTMGSMLFVGCAALAVLALRPDVPGDGGKVVAQAPGEGETGGGSANIAASGGAKGPLSPEAENDIARGKLKKKLNVGLAEIPLKEALSWFGTQTETQFHLDMKALTDATIAADTPVTLGLNGISAQMALDLIFGSLELGYTFREGVIIVTTKEKLDEQLETRVYTVPADAADEIRDVVTATVRPASWDENGGLGSILPFRDSLVVSQTAERQREVAELIEELSGIAQRSPAKQAAKEQYPGYPSRVGGRRDTSSGLARGCGQPGSSGAPPGVSTGPAGASAPGGKTDAGSPTVETEDGRVLPAGSSGPGGAEPGDGRNGGGEGTGSPDGGGLGGSGGEGSGAGGLGGGSGGEGGLGGAGGPGGGGGSQRGGGRRR